MGFVMIFVFDIAHIFANIHKIYKMRFPKVFISRAEYKCKKTELNEYVLTIYW